MITDQICQAWEQLPQFALAPIKVDTNKCPYGVVYQDASRNDEWVAKKSVNAMVAEDRAWELRNCIYKDRQTFTYLMKSNGFNLKQQQPLPVELGNFYSTFMQCRDTAQQMKMYCDFFDMHPEFIGLTNTLQNIPAEFKNYYATFGSEYIARKAYKMSRIKPEYDSFVLEEVIKKNVLQWFTVGKKYTRKGIKGMLQAIYNALGLVNITAKATDINKWFETNECTVTVGGKTSLAYLLTKIK